MELQVLDQNVIVKAFAAQGGTDALFERIAEQARSFIPDVTTKKGREEIGSVAMKVSKSKTLAEKYAKDLVADEKARIKLIDDDRIQFCKKMDSLRDEILAPRDAWEQAEKDRVAKHEAVINQIKEAAQWLITATSQELHKNLNWLESLTIDSSLEDYEEKAKLARYESIELLKKGIASIEAYEAEQAELERLRKAEQERQQREHEERIAREAAEKATREAEEKARAEAQRVEREQREAAEREARLKAEKEAAELRATQAAEMERKRIEAEQLAQAEAARKAEEARLANVEYMRSINSEAVKALCFAVPGLTEDMAKDVVRAIAKNSVPNVAIKY
jgi:hypothetical protein